ncbi:SWIM zinc finger family protein [Streptomyces sp. NPDC005012]|uniref:SWIM zinc finger family protein n=1 Tax=Streptomyces sp. NPDC005012 TaxID=3154558 RepID=UPI0033A6DF7D
MSGARLPGTGTREESAGTGTREESGGHSPQNGAAEGGADAPRAIGGPTGGGSPAEAARRALRVARALARPTTPAERDPAPSSTSPSAADGATDREPAAEPAAGPAGARPSAAARAAIRRREPVAESEPGSTRPEGGTGTTPQDADAAPGFARGPVPGAGTEPPKPPSGEPSPAERAREALRAARAAAEPAHAPGGTAPTGDLSEDALVADRGDDAAVAASRASALAARARKAATERAPDRINQSPTRADAERDEAEANDTAARDVNDTTRHRGVPPRDPRPVQDALPHDPPAPPSTRPRGAGDDHRKTFDRLPPREEGAALAETPWGEAWLTALTERALDPARLARGRRYAEGGRVDSITVTPGLAIAYVHGSRPRPYRAQVRVRTLEDDEWEAFLDAVAERPAHIAALLDRRLPEALLDGGVGAPLLPRRGDLLPFCGCPDTGRPCKHAAALCYQTARLLDADPFALLLLRGRGEREILDALSRRNAAHAARAAAEARASRRRDGGVPEGLRAKDALARAASGLPPLPAPLPPPEHPGQPPAYPAAPGGPDPYALDQLATHAAVRAHALLTTGEDQVGGLTLWQDAVRIAAARPGSGLTAATRTLYSSLAAAAGRTPVELARAVAAWRQGGPAGLAVLEGEPWDPPAGRFDRARPLLLAAGLAPFRPWRNRLTHPVGHAQIRLGQDNLWYAYESEPGADDWWPRGTADADPVAALSALGPGLDPAELPPEPQVHTTDARR